MFQIPDYTFFVDMAIACLIGFFLGWERHEAGKTIGARSMMLLILGAFLFTYASLNIGTDHGRVVAQIVTGVGFIGAGIIFKKEDKAVANLTTAILVWTVAALGVLIGMGMRVEALTSAFVVYFILILRKRIHKDG